MNYPKIRIKEALAVYKDITGKKLTQEGLSKLIEHKSAESNISYLISQCSNGKKDMPSSVLIQISKICGVSIDFLLGKEEDNYWISPSCNKLDRKIKELQRVSDEMLYNLHRLKD